MKKYGKAWENQDVNLILECFTINGVYQESPLAKPYKGHKEIAQFWKKEVVNNTKDIKFKLKKCYLSENKQIGFAEWDCINVYCGQKEKMVGIMLLKMKGDKITYLNEYWNEQEI
ncbi:MAG: nuclear transport factor 2 family protein [Candidatus Nanoarchaeia archaeon]|nr:nuclear transport factor 2 family protein [Candidatus Nanoarchaeia archaeon]